VKRGNISATVSPGQTYVDVASTTFEGHGLAIGDYVLFNDATLTPTVHYSSVDGASNQFWPFNHASSALTSDSQHFEQAITSEIRRVVAIEGLSSGGRLFLDDPVHYEHTAGAYTIRVVRFQQASDTGSPNINADGTITNPVRRLLFSGDTLPSFCMEHSIRNRDVGSYSNENSNVPGSTAQAQTASN